MRQGKRGEDEKPFSSSRKLGDETQGRKVLPINGGIIFFYGGLTIGMGRMGGKGHSLGDFYLTFKQKFAMDLGLGSLPKLPSSTWNKRERERERKKNSLLCEKTENTLSKVLYTYTRQEGNP